MTRSCIIDNVSSRTFTIIVTILTVNVLFCFLIGGLVGNKKTNTQVILGTTYEDISTDNNTTWFYNRGKGASKTIFLDNHNDKTNIVFAFQIPVPRENRIMEYSRWERNLIGALNITVYCEGMQDKTDENMFMLDVRIAFRNKEEEDDDWKLYAKSNKTLHLSCTTINDNGECQYLSGSLFDFTFIFHDYYLINVRIPELKKFADVWLTVSNQSALFSKIWVSFKTCLLTLNIIILIWFIQQVYAVERRFLFHDRFFVYLASILCIVNSPYDCINLYSDSRFFYAVKDIVEMIFYSSLFFLWIISAEKTMFVGNVTPFLLFFKRKLLILIVLPVMIIIFAVYEEITLRYQFSKPCDTLGTILMFIISGIIVLSYYWFMCYLLMQTFINIPSRFNTSSANINAATIVFRLKILILASFICATMTIAFILKRFVNHFLCEEKSSAAFTFGVYGIWNSYVFGLLIFYAPMRIRFPKNEEIIQEEMDLCDKY